MCYNANKGKYMIKSILVTLLFAFSVSAHADQLLSVAPDGAGFFTANTNVLLWENPKSTATVVHLPGGTGSFNVTQLWPREKVHSFGSILTLLLASGNVSSAYIDSPYSLGGNDISARRSEDHLARVAKALQAIHSKTNNPIWLFGHSNGAISAMEMYSYLSKTNDQHILGGIILSSSRNELIVPATMNIPVLFMHHRNDTCVNTMYADARQRYEEVKAVNKNRTEFATITSAFTPNTRPCFSGAHMYENNYAEIAQIIEKFTTQ
jgi:hypothetical protein